MADEVLLPCLLCGADAEIVPSLVDGERVFQCQCTSCAAVAPENTNQQRAIDFWNAWNADLDDHEDDEDDEAMTEE